MKKLIIFLSIVSIPAVLFYSLKIKSAQEMVKPVAVISETYDAVISRGGSAEVQCGEGDNGTTAVFENGNFSGNINIGDSIDISVSVRDNASNNAGGLVTWKLFDYGTLQIKGCRAHFIAPNNIGSAYQVSSTIMALISKKTAPSPTVNAYARGESGPMDVHTAPITKINIYNQANNIHNNRSINPNRTYCSPGYSYNATSNVCCPISFPYYYNGNHGQRPVGCYKSCPYIGDCDSRIVNY